MLEVVFPDTSRLEDERLCFATSEAHLFEGRFTRPALAADLLLSLAQVVGSRFYTPPAMVARLVRESDPVITCAREQMRWEGFSSCCSVYARVDMEQGALEGSLISCGTTNVDFGGEFRAALARARTLSHCGISVGRDYLQLSAKEQVTEKRVKLPRRWLQGFIEAQYHQLSMELYAELSAIEFRRFVQSVPATSSRSSGFLQKLGKGVRLGFREIEGSLPLSGWDRLKVMQRLLQHSGKVRIFGNSGGATAWQMEVPDGVFTLVLSPSSSRGFSGEGQALYALSFDSDRELEEKLVRALGWDTPKTVAELASRMERSEEETERALARLSARGELGYDLKQEGFYRRELPFIPPDLESLHPRLKSARALLDSVRYEGGRAMVDSGDTTYVVSWTDGEASCNCPWFSGHSLDRGPCKHILAAQWSLRR